MSREQNNSLNLNTIDIFKKEKVRKEEEKELNIKTPKKIISKSNIKSEEIKNIKNNIINKIDVPPYKSKENENENEKKLKEKENIIKETENYKKEENKKLKEKQPQRKKEWKSWSSQEKLMFYELIANGGNYSSLQKLFKTMNDVKFFFNFFYFRK